MVSDWTAGFSLRSNEHGTIVTAESRFRPRSVLVRAMLPIMRRNFHHTQNAILAGLKEFSEGSSTSRPEES